MVFVTGDIHGWLDIGKLTPDRWPEGRGLDKSDYLVICGDFGLLWSNPPSLEEKYFLDWLNSRPWTTLFIDGNHENYDLLDALETRQWHGGKVGILPSHPSILHLLRGQVYDMGRDGLWFTMGGAPSHDREWRMEGESWWPRELPSEEEYAEGIANLERVGWKVDYVFTHDVPRSYRRHAMSRHYDPSREQDDDLSAYLQRVDDCIDKDRLKVWYAGHYHDDLMLRDPQHAELYHQIVPLGALPDGRVHRHLSYCDESWMGVEGLRRRWREWVLSRRIRGATITWVDNECIRMTTDSMFGEIRFYAREGHPEAVEMLVTRNSDCRPMFRTRFELTDALRAKELFLEMSEVICHGDLAGKTRVLICCNAGVSTERFCKRLSATCEAMSLDYEFCALSLDEAMAARGHFDAVLVAPQVGYMRHDIVGAFPSARVVDIPSDPFSRLDTDQTLQLLFSALGEGLAPQAPGTDCHIVRNIGRGRDVLAITVVNRERSTYIGYRCFQHGEITLDGAVCKTHVHFMDIEDVVATVRLDGVDVSSLDAIGIALPGIVNEGSSTLPSDGVSDYELGRAIERRFGVEVFVDNLSNAGAVGCYMAQTTYDSVVFHMQRTGSTICEQGNVVDGHLVKGRRNAAGELLPLTRLMSYSGDVEEMCWTSEGMTEVVANYLAAPVTTVAPDVIYVSCFLVKDVRALRARLLEIFPPHLVPALALIADFRQLAFLGVLALCTEKLNHPRPHRKW